MTSINPPIIGINCNITIDGIGYWLAPSSYRVQRSRHAKLIFTAGTTVQEVEAEPNKRIFTFVVEARDGILPHDGLSVATRGSDFRNALSTSYNKLSLVEFVDPLSQTWSVHFDNVSETLNDVRAQVLRPGFLIAVELVEQ